MDAIALFDPISSAAFLKQSVKDFGLHVIGVFTRPIPVFKEHYHTTEDALFLHCDEVIVAETKEEIIQQLQRSKFTIKAAVAGIDSGVGLADQVAHELGLWSNPLELSNARRDKGEMRQILQKHGFSCPAFTLCKTDEDVINFAQNHPFPLVIKTPKGAATSQVYICEDVDSLRKSFQDILHHDNFFGERAKYAVLEEYIGGKEYVVNTFSDGKNVYATDVWYYDKINTEEFKNIYYNVIFQSLTSPSFQPLCKYAVAVVRAFGIQRGPAHLEIKDDPRRGPTLIEINSRLAGARMPLFLKDHSNFDPYRKTIEVFVQGKTEIPHPIVVNKHCAVALCPVLQGGKVENIAGIEAITKLDSYESHILTIQPGDKLVSTTDMTTTPLLVFLANADQNQLMKDIQNTHQLFHVTFAPHAIS